MPPKVLEELHTVVEGIGDGRRRHDRSERMAVAHRLTHDHDVRHDALGLKRPEMHAESAIACLHLVGDTKPSGSTDVAIDLGEIARRRHELATHARTRLGDERGQMDTGTFKTLDDVAHGGSIVDAGTRIILLVAAAIDIGNRRRMDPVRRAGAARPRVLVRANVDQRVRVSVIGRFENDRVAPAGVCPCQAQGQLVRLAR